MRATTQNVEVGAQFDIELGATPTTGYSWEIETLPAGLQLVGTDFISAPAAAVGDGGTQVFHLRAAQAGRFEVQLQLKRRWESTPIACERVAIEAR